MCIGVPKPPKVDPATQKTPDPAIIRNEYLDNMDPASRALRQGRSSLRIERGSGGASAPAPASSPAPTVTPSPRPAGSTGSTPVRGAVGGPGLPRSVFL